MSDSVAVFAVSAVAFVAATFYAVFGGADFGGGVWDALASGPRRTEQRATIAHALGPVWETNHVWLIFLMVCAFTCFPAAYAHAFVALYVPLSIVLVGIILRGAAFAYRSSQYDATRFTSFWSAVFGMASIVAPFAFGAAVGGLSLPGGAWWSPFALCTGLLGVALCAQLAAVFLTLESTGSLAEDFRRRAVIATFVVAALGAAVMAVARAGSPATFAALLAPLPALAVGFAMLSGIVLLVLLGFRHFHAARVAVALEAGATIAAWSAAYAGTLAGEPAPPEILRAFLVLTAAGALVLGPSLWLLFRLFKGERSTT